MLLIINYIDENCRCHKRQFFISHIPKNISEFPYGARKIIKSYPGSNYYVQVDLGVT
ncbi:MAG: hypothetical protein J1F32_01590 [Erysipelotrichales bacterium]|nr:hypothetical protein [Erysipelotrichales bacterium]